MSLFDPLRLGPLELPHRVAMAPMTRNRAGEGNAPGERNAEYYAQRAGAALIVTEAAQISPQGVGYPATPGIHSAAQIEGWRRVVGAVREAGGRILLQLWHVGRISHSSMQPGGALPVAPSAVAAAGQAMTHDGMKPFETPRALAASEIPDLVADYRAAAENARQAGFDGVEIHGANGYLLDQFLRDGANRRGDAYGGPVANRARLPVEVAEAVAGVWGADRVGYRISPFQSFNDMADSDPPATFSHLARALDRLGLAYLHVVETDAPGAADADAPAETFLARRHPLFATLRDLFSGALIVNGGYDRARGEAVLAAGAADVVAYAKLFLANPDLPRRFAAAAPLNPPNKATFYGGGRTGYTDYPFLDAKNGFPLSRE